eukprot:TRINITY_DN938_c1_g1_i1.p1 TRINITY_DN938_c1_g1~~TRINITY_DN938_c1_g1_i1.p1  ORF type:complete len:139 (+),score=18.81 TRINITY_DN938_c1_g1_i1:205-621(+)
MQDVRKDLNDRVNTGVLLSFAELQTLSKRVLSFVSEQARKDFEELMTLDQHYCQSPYFNPQLRQEIPPLTPVPLFEDFRTLSSVSISTHTPCAQSKMRQLQENIHHYLLRLLDMSESQHRERLQLMKIIISHIEGVTS